MTDLSSLIGKIAVTNSEMSPEGTIIIDDEVYDAQTDGARQGSEGYKS